MHVKRKQYLAVCLLVIVGRRLLIGQRSKRQREVGSAQSAMFVGLVTQQRLPHVEGLVATGVGADMRLVMGVTGPAVSHPRAIQLL